MPHFEFEQARHAAGDRLVAGVDEVGRGPIAGPVVAAAVILDPANIPAGIDDSKKLTLAKRERLDTEIRATAICVSIAEIGPEEIDRINIRQATLLAMTRALAGLMRSPCHVLVDGNDIPSAWKSRGTSVIKGDATSLSIGAASIVAKVARDRMMRDACSRWPAYGFSRHVGYSTAEHRGAVEAHGPCPIHRLSFGFLKAYRPESATLFSGA